MSFKNKIITRLKAGQKKKILFIDGHDLRAQKAAALHVEEGAIEPILLLTKVDLTIPKEIKTILISDEKYREDELVAKYVERRKGKEDAEAAKKVVFTPHFFSMLLLELNEIDGVIGGLVNPTSDILRAAFKIIGPKPGIKTISSVMIMEKKAEAILFADISVLPEPTKEQLVDIAYNTNKFAEQLDIEPKIAFLSFSTNGSANHPRAILVQKATNEYNFKYKPKFPALGEIQLDAALDIEVRKAKYKKPFYEGASKILIFPSLDAGNIGYKIAQRMGGYGAIGPIITGVNKPVNDLSRGAKEMDIYNTALITAMQSTK
jgi:phosphate acetyltransferase